MKIDTVILENFKSFHDRQRIPIQDLTLFMGANSSGKSSAIQALMILKQTLECNSPEVDLLLSGKYANIGDFNDALNKSEGDYFVIGLEHPQNEDGDRGTILWRFGRNESIISEPLLKEIRITSPMGQVLLQREPQVRGRYRVCINGVPSQYFIMVENIAFKETRMGYNSKLNELFYQFLKELSLILFSKKTTERPKLERDTFMPVFGLMNFDQALFSEYLSKGIQIENNCVLQLMEDFCKSLSEDSYYEGIYGSRLRSIYWNAVMMDTEKASELKVVCDKYRTLLLEYCADGKNRNVLDAFFQIDYPFSELYEAAYEQLSLLKDVSRSYNSCLDLLKKKVVYLGPLREKPQGLYNLGFESFPQYVGPSGAYFASVLFHENKNKMFILPHDRNESISLEEACAEWLDYIGVANKATAEKQGSFGIHVSISNLYDQEADIMNVGIGTSQVLPVLISGLLSSCNDLLVFEQPELHLHPYSQSRLADFFVALAKTGRTVIVETHSEQMLTRLRYLVLDERICHDHLKVVFFENTDCTRVYEARLDNYGGIQYPENFRDTTEKLIEDLLYKSLAKRGKRRD